MAETASVFLDSSTRRLEQHMGRIRSCLERLTDEQVWTRASDNENAIGNLMLHLAGNVRQWIVSGIGGKPDVRVRDREFSTRGDVAKEDLVERLGTTVQDACAVIAQLTEARLAERVRIQNYDVTVLEAVYHVVEHFALHTGQILYATKLLTHEDLGFYRHLQQPTHAEKTP